jgi:hypothetical protein
MQAWEAGSGSNQKLEAVLPVRPSSCHPANVIWAVVAGTALHPRRGNASGPRVQRSEPEEYVSC